ncbi:MAG: hypothetical protein JO362_17235 [Streptomycetaceae bacterium]|nr:hypothetical protein [Streptomycetaceae bacterium]
MLRGSTAITARPAPSALRLLQAQDGRCPLCRELLLHADHELQSPHDWEQWLKVTRTAIRKHAIITEADNGTPDKPAVPRLVHARCQRRLTTGNGSRPALLPARMP